MNVRKPTKEEYQRMSSEIRIGKCSNGKDNNGIKLFIGQFDTKNEASWWLVHQIREWRVSLALSGGHNYPYLWRMTLRQSIMTTLWPISHPDHSRSRGQLMWMIFIDRYEGAKPSWQPIPCGFHGVYVGSTHASLHGNYLHITIKGPTMQSDLLYMEGDPEHLGTLLSTRKFPHIKGFKSTLYHYINHKPYPSWGMWILPSSCTLEFLESLLLLT